MMWRVIVASACMLLVLGGCSQGRGGSCQLPADCEKPLICCKPEGPLAVPSDRGVCLPDDECDTYWSDTSTDTVTDGEDTPADQDEEDLPTDGVPDPVEEDPGMEDPPEDSPEDPPEDPPAEDTVEDPGAEDVAEDTPDEMDTD